MTHRCTYKQTRLHNLHEEPTGCAAHTWLLKSLTIAYRLQLALYYIVTALN